MSVEHGCRIRVYNALCYFDIQEYPLTLFEIWLYAYDETKKGELISFEEVALACEELCDKNLIHTSQGYWYLPGREKLVFLRKDRYEAFFAKQNVTARRLRLLSFLPFVTGIALCNSLPLQNSRSDSDSDVLFFTRDGKLWTARFFVVVVLMILRWRPTQRRRKNTICPSFFISDRGISLEQIRLQDDIYLDYWTATLLWVYDQDFSRLTFERAQAWLKNLLPLYESQFTSTSHFIKHSALSGFFKRFFEMVFNFRCVELVLFYVQYNWFLPENLKNLSKLSSGVVIDDRMLKFHDKDRREFFREEYQRCINNSTLNEDLFS